MTLDDSAAILDIGEKHCMQLLLDGKLIGWQRISQRHARHFSGEPGRRPVHKELKKCPREVRRATIGAVIVDGNSVRARRRRLDA